MRKIRQFDATPVTADKLAVRPSDMKGLLPAYYGSDAVKGRAVSTPRDEMQLMAMRRRQMRRLKKRPAAALPRKHWMFVKSGEPMKSEDLSQTAASIFKEDDGDLEAKLKEVRDKRLGIKADAYDDTAPFWAREEKQRNPDWTISDTLPSHSTPTIPAPASDALPPGDNHHHQQQQVDPTQSIAATPPGARPTAPPFVDIDERVREEGDGGAGEKSEGGGVMTKIGGRRLHLGPERFVNRVLDTQPQTEAEREQKALQRQNRPQHEESLPNAGQSLIRQLKEKARSFEQYGVDPDMVDSLKANLQYYPGIERQQRKAEMMEFSRSFEEILEEGRASVDNCNAMIKAAAMKGDVDMCLSIHDKMKLHGFDPNADTYVGLIQAATVKKNAAMARLFYLRMRSQLITPTEKVYAALINAHVQEGDLTAGFALLRKMEDEGLKPNVIVYTTLIDGLVDQNKIDKAWRVFHDIRTWKLIDPDEVLFTVMIKACARRREAEKAINLLDDMRAMGQYPTDVTYTELIHACSRRADFFQKAFDFYNQMQAEDMPVGVQVFEHLLGACASKGDVKKAKEVVKQMGRREIPMTQWMYHQLISVFATAMRLPKVSDNERLCNLRYAWSVVQDMRRKELPIDTHSLNAVMQVYINGGFAQYAIDMLQQFAHFKCEPDATTYFALLRTLGKDLKDPGRFFALWDYMRENSKVVPNQAMLHLALDTAMTSRSAARTVKVLQEMYQLKVYPTAQLTDRLAKVGRKITEIHRMVALFIKLQKEDVWTKRKNETAVMLSKIDEHELRLFQEGQHYSQLGPKLSPEDEVRKKFFKSRERLYGKRKWLPLGEYIQAKQKGGEHYAERKDRPKPVLVTG
ncbi:unnamed protein product [Vitrella brassicaformis CCMP3155]|uniref:Pentacotripeptide-repeat region of PRORP domain-containing protein n=4 Tax=Vitrella brassicaformis TaxID=1169539 RepID=A0A0G4EDU5_VITBC|nr:unnamed protein product [Vitrella brassicaformis CCMP3155]|eukprot:CEL94120.1 unnamed protein product [Vitrella brassicaformis CCMP3155]